MGKADSSVWKENAREKRERVFLSWKGANAHTHSLTSRRNVMEKEADEGSEKGKRCSDYLYLDTNKAIGEFPVCLLGKLVFFR